MGSEPQSALDRLWKGYGALFRDFDDLSLARWLCQTLGQIEGKALRLSHPLIGAYRVAAHVAHERQVWFKRLATQPQAFLDSPCCRAPMLPLLTRDVKETGLVCQHCNETLVPVDELPPSVSLQTMQWAEAYAPVHAVAHWEDRQRKQCGSYERALEDAAAEAERLLADAGTRLAPSLLDFYPTIIWEDQDECLEVRPEDIQ